MMYVRPVKDINFLATFPNPGPWGSLESPSDPLHLELSLMLEPNRNSSCVALFELVLRSICHVPFCFIILFF